MIKGLDQWKQIKDVLLEHYFAKEAPVVDEVIVDAIKKNAHPLNSKDDLQPLIDKIGDARIVMLGEASHGTHDFYAWRAHISKKLIEEKGFSFIAVEGDWPDAYKLNRFVKGYDTEHESAFEVLHGLSRWPSWILANWEMIALADWLQKHNQYLPADKKAGFYGLDIYGLWESTETILRYLKSIYPGALKLAEEAFHCFSPYHKDEDRAYGHASRLVPEFCQHEIVALLKEAIQKRPSYDRDHEHVFNAEQEAYINLNAEKYYRTIIEGGQHSWNARDRQMADTLNRLLKFHGENAKAIVWQHNTHIGDARATDMTLDGMFNIGELVRLQYHRENVALVGFGSYEGNVMAGRNLNGTMQSMLMPPAKESSWESLLHKAGKENKFLWMQDFADNAMLMENHLEHRAIGAVYHPKSEHFGNYIPTILPSKYDAFIYLDQTRALHPLHIEPDGHKMPETFPFGV